MKSVKFGIFALATLVAGTAAIAHAKRAVGIFIQTNPGSWEKIAPGDYNPLNCQTSTTLFCTYTVNTTALPTGQTSYTTKQLQDAHAVGHDANKIYVQ